MSQPFDPYSQWLGVKSVDRPVDYYTLLGLKRFESNGEVIETAFHQRYRDIRRYQVGEHSQAAVSLLQELAKAFDCLSKQDSKSTYDAVLEQKFGRDEGPQVTRGLESGHRAAVDGAKRSVEPKRSSTQSNTKGVSASSSDRANSGGAGNSVAATNRLEGYWVMTPDQKRKAGPFTFDQLCAAVEQGKLPAQALLAHSDWPNPRSASSVFPELSRSTRKTHVAQVVEEIDESELVDAGFELTEIEGDESNSTALASLKPIRGGSTPHAIGSRRDVWLYGLLGFLGVALIVFVVTIVLLIRTLWNHPSFRGPANQFANRVGIGGPSSLNETGESVNLIALVQLPRDQWGLPWSLVNGVLISPTVGPAQLHIPYAPPDRYRISLEVRRVSGVDSFNVALPVENSQVMGVIDGYGGSTTGLSLVRGMSPDQNGTGVMGRRFLDSQFHTIEYAVTERSVSLFIDGEFISTWEGNSTELSMDFRYWTPNFQRDILVGSWHSGFEIRRIELFPAR